MHISDIKLILSIEDVVRLLLGQLLSGRLGGHVVEDLRVGGEELDVIVAVLDLGTIDRSSVLSGDAIVDEGAFGGADQSDDRLYQLFIVPPPVQRLIVVVVVVVVGNI